MLIQEKNGHLNDSQVGGRMLDWLELEWHEAGKRILRKRTIGGRELSLKFLSENPKHSQGDILFQDKALIIAVRIQECRCLVIQPESMLQVASVCYEIGNKHLPLFYESDQLLIPFEQPLLNLLIAQGYKVTEEQRQLLQPLSTSVVGHAHGGETLFSKIMKLTSPA